MQKSLYLGIMTGTSLDAIDLALAGFEDSGIQVVALGEKAFSKELQEYLKDIPNRLTIKEFSQLNIRYTKEIANAVNQFLNENAILSNQIRAIGLHGQTLWHQPETEEFLGEITRSTLQIGSGTYLAVKTGVDVVSDFRISDMAFGGQGAPLVPIFDYTFLSEPNDVIVLNIGGIANITYLKANGTKQEVIAFDTGAGNCLIDLVVRERIGMAYDKDGMFARSGNSNKQVLERLMNEPYLDKDYPKSTGKELFNIDFLKKYGVLELHTNDALATLTYFTALSIAKNIDKVTQSEFKLKIAGGGAENKFLVELLEKCIPNAKVETTKLQGIDISNSREALLMSYLAYLRVNEKTGNMPSVTGAKGEAILGAIAKSNR